MSKKITLRLLAAKLGVAHSTVQRALSGHPHVSPELRTRITRLAARMGYTLPSHRTGSVAVVVRSMNFCEYLAPLINRLCAALNKAGFFPCIIAEADMKTVNEFLYDGVISTTWSSGFEKDYPKEHGLPIIALNTEANPQEGIPVVGSAEEQGVTLALEYLFSAGHRRIAIAATDDLHSGSRRQRIAAYRKFCEEKKIALPDAVFDFTAQEQIAAAVSSGRFDALLWATEGNMPAFYALLRKRRIRVPEDLSLIGWESELSSAFLLPPLTTIRQNFEMLAEESVQMLQKRLAGEPLPADIRVPYQLIERESVLKR